jgi:hypothetical protein
LAAIETVAGTLMPALALKAIVVCVATGLLMDAVQAATAPGPRVAGVHERLLRTEVTILVAVPPVAVAVIWLLSSAEARAPETAMETELAGAASVMDTFARIPSAIRLLLIPVAIHM